MDRTDTVPVDLILCILVGTYTAPVSEQNFIILDETICLSSNHPVDSFTVLPDCIIPCFMVAFIAFEGKRKWITPRPVDKMLLSTIDAAYKLLIRGENPCLFPHKIF
ncbi:hypothetical protein AVEN_306-1 [Araneus ventricosus]|uniref:Uncharacterized protein n=1 Tax=Araneus ventricosus TaxID=182803 RepID=A0A4Y2I3N0_ARAVE|nr:hypothetical protein AVEN_306-1 [Araneus ventricosus]